MSWKREWKEEEGRKNISSGEAHFDICLSYVRWICVEIKEKRSREKEKFAFDLVISNFSGLLIRYIRCREHENLIILTYVGFSHFHALFIPSHLVCFWVEEFMRILIQRMTHKCMYIYVGIEPHIMDDNGIIFSNALRHKQHGVKWIRTNVASLLLSEQVLN